MTNLCSLSKHRAPFCPSCGNVAANWSEYRETTDSGPISAIVANVLVQLSWVCNCCHFDVSVKASKAQSYEMQRSREATND